MTTPTTTGSITTDDQTNAEERRRQGEFVRGVSTARHWVTSDGNEDSNVTLYPLERDRYHLYVAYNCPWCHRVLLGRAIMGLEDVISVNVVFPNRSHEDDARGPNLWKFAPEGMTGINGTHVTFPACTEDTVMNKTYIRDIYEACNIENQTSVPILFDKVTRTVVNNESAEILRMMGTVFRPLAKYPHHELYPPALMETINVLNDWIYTDIANGAYKAGFSSRTEIYETAYHKFFAALQRINDTILSQSTFLTGDTVTEADVRLFPTVYRLDPIYHNRFKLNQCYLWERYPHIWRWMGDMMRSSPGMDQVTNDEMLQHCRQGYFGRTGNGVIPLGPPGYPACYLQPHSSH